ncbi:MAG TPA: zinc dependent phospholipase C family protein [Spirochaetota bacterium]|nr:zinc dependent phospholipase C family protein [Spirochaetota bacterium]HPG49055.1 zinc dependent phospholipase C family protein [Spirochaetota bacterium]HPN11870.1 zinc dependent phospholipase C family protein [Spirochaetota bacterium]
MPGIVTHNRILKESILSLSKKEKKSYLLKSIETLFNSPQHMTAGLFGSIGPDIFDFIPRINKRKYYGNDISFYIHNGGADKLIHTMIKTIYDYHDKNTEWAATQRAYLYGFISHIVSDSLFHPFIFYYSGFPDTYTRKEINFFREQNLFFQYHLDNYFQYHDEKAVHFDFSINEMLPVKADRNLHRMDQPVLSLLLNTIKLVYPEIFRKLILFKLDKNKSDNFLPVSYLDMVPFLIRLAYRLKRNNNKRMSNFFRSLRRNNLFYSDFLIRYPMQKKFNKNILNLHRERWENPTGKPGLHYESVNNLMTLACEKTIELWEKIESSLYAKEDLSVLNEFNVNAYTGDSKLSYHDMRIKRPIRLSI